MFPPPAYTQFPSSVCGLPPLYHMFPIFAFFRPHHSYNNRQLYTCGFVPVWTPFFFLLSSSHASNSFLQIRTRFPIYMIGNSSRWYQFTIMDLETFAISAASSGVR